MTELTRDRFEKLSKAIYLDAPAELIAHLAISVAVRALGYTSSMQLARHIVEFRKASTEYGMALLDPNSPESLEEAEIQKMMDDVELDDAALEVAYER